MNINTALEQIKALGTNGCNCDVENEDILTQVQQWHATLDIEVLEVTADSVTIHFKTLPADTRKFAEELYEFCPDLIDQHFGCFDDLFASMDELDEDTKHLLEGIDFTSDTYGLELLERALTMDGRVQLWWD